jgi:hypothetical protein
MKIESPSNSSIGRPIGNSMTFCRMQLVLGRDSAIIDKHFVNYLLDLVIVLHAVPKSAIDPNNP